MCKSMCNSSYVSRVEAEQERTLFVGSVPVWSTEVSCHNSSLFIQLRVNKKKKHKPKFKVQEFEEGKKKKTIDIFRKEEAVSTLPLTC